MKKLETIAKKEILPKAMGKIRDGIYRCLGIDRILAVYGVYELSKMVKNIPNSY